jgi:hypothetical protein
MKRSDAFPSNYLAQGDVPSPIRAVIADVYPVTMKGDDGDEKKTAMTFTNQHLKPMVINNTNWMVCEEAYGDDSDHWKGKPVEIYVDQSVMFGKKRVGGLRLRIPVGAPPQSNGAVTFTFDQALAEAAKASIGREALVAALKAAGRNGWLASRDTPLVLEMIQKAKPPETEQGFDQPLPQVTGVDEIPFAWMAPLLLPFLMILGA